MDDYEQIRQLKYRYLRSLDLKLWDEFGDTLTPDVSTDYGERVSFDNRDAVVEYMRAALPASIITVHQVHHPEISVSGDDATGRWYLQDIVLVTEQKLMLSGAAFYEDGYRRGEDGVWRISRTGYQRSYEAIQPLPEGWQFTANRFAKA